MEIKFIPVTRIYEEVRDTLNIRTEQVYGTDQQFEGRFMGECEEILKHYSGRKHAFITTSGTASITISASLFSNKQGAPKLVPFSIASCNAVITSG